jgi:hypothetical protein
MILFARVPLALFAASLLVRAQNPDVLAIMTKATANISTATEGRRQFVYRQKIRASLIRTNGKTARKETREYTVIPQASTTEKTLVAFSGEYLLGKRMVAYTTPGLKDKGDEADRRNMQVVTEDLVSAGKSRGRSRARAVPRLSSGERRGAGFQRGNIRGAPARNRLVALAGRSVLHSRGKVPAGDVHGTPAPSSETSQYVSGCRSPVQPFPLSYQSGSHAWTRHDGQVSRRGNGWGADGNGRDPRVAAG